MDELKEYYGIETTEGDRAVLFLSILAEEVERTAKTLERASNASQRIDALKRQEAIKWAAKTLQKGTR